MHCSRSRHACSNSMPTTFRYRNPIHLIVTLQARSTVADSPPLRVRIDWDGKWDDKMARHLIVNVLDDNNPF